MPIPFLSDISAQSGTFAGDLTVSGTYPKITLTDTDHNPDFTIIGGNGQFGIYDETNSTYRLQINSSGTTSFTGDIIQGSHLHTFANGAYLEIGTGASNTAQITFNADYDGGQTATYTPHYSGASSAGMSIIKMPSGGVGGIEFYVKKHGTTGGSHNLSTFNKILNLHQDGESTFSGDVGIGGAPSAALDITTAGNTSDGTYYSTFTINNTGTSTWSRIRFDRGGVAKWGLSLGTDDKFRISNLFTGGTTANPNDNALVIDENGLVGIGCDPSPQDGITDNPALVVGDTTGSSQISIISQSNNYGYLLFGDSTAATADRYQGQVRYYHNDDELQLLASNTVGLKLLSTSATFTGRVIIGDDAITTDKPGLVVGDTTNNGQITIRGQQPTLFFDKTGANNAVILTDAVSLKFKNGTIDSEGSDQLTLDTSGNATFEGSVTATSLIKSGGTSSQYLMADGSVSTSVSATDNTKLPLAGGTLTGDLFFNVANQEIRFTHDSDGFITHNVVGRDIVFKTSQSSSLDKTPLTLHGTGGGATFEGEVTVKQDLIVGDSTSANSTQAFGAFDQLRFDNSYSDTNRGPNKIVMHDNSGGWIGGFGIHSDTVSYYTGGTHKFYKTTSQSASNELLKLESTGATFAGTIVAGDGTQAINNDADLTLRNGNSFVGIDLKSARTSGNIGGLRYYGTSSDSVPKAQLLVETDGQLKYYNGTNGAQPRLTINSSGDAGIGVSDPDAKLEIIGNGRTNSSMSLRVRSDDDQQLFYVRDDGVVSVTHNYFYVDNSSGIYSNGKIHARAGVTDDGGDLGLGGSGAIGNLTLTSNTSALFNGHVHLATLGSMISFYGNSSEDHAIVSKNLSGNADDDFRINSYGGFFINLDSNGNNDNSADFKIVRHSSTGAVSASDTLFTLRHEDAYATFAEDVQINGKLTVKGDEFTLGDGNYEKVLFDTSPSAPTGNGSLFITPQTIPGSGTANFTTWFRGNGSGSGNTRHHVQIDNNLTVGGNLYVTGTSTTVNVEDLNVEQGEITLNYNASSNTSSSADGAGIRIQDAVDASNDATISWNATSDEFEFSHPIKVAGVDYKIATFGTDNHHQYRMTGNADHTLTLTCGSYYQAEIIITAHQTNGGANNNLYIRGIWSNNHTSHHWDEIEHIGGLTGSSFTITNGQNGNTTNSGKLEIAHDYVSGTFAGLEVRVKEYFGTHAYTIS